MQLEVTRSFEGSSEAMRCKLSAMEERLRNKFRADTAWIDEHTMTIGAPGVRGRLALGEGDLTVTLEVSAVLRPLRARIERELGREIDRVLSPT